jgi:hypothetical protein
MEQLIDEVSKLTTQLHGTECCFSAAQEIPCILCSSYNHLRIIPPTSLLGPKAALFLLVFSPISYVYFSSFLCMLHALPT